MGYEGIAKDLRAKNQNVLTYVERWRDMFKDESRLTARPRENKNCFIVLFRSVRTDLPYEFRRVVKHSFCRKKIK